jgi:hypothetical protein
MNAYSWVSAIVLWFLPIHSDARQDAILSDKSDPVLSNTDKSAYVWNELTSNAGYSESYNYQLFADSEKIRAFHPSGVWESSDGKHWKKTGLTNIVRNQAFLDYVRFKGAIYGLGTLEGNIEHFTQTTQIARTTDYTRWEILAKESNLPRRFFYHPFVFSDKIWIIGGTDNVRKYMDVWNSDDAVHWTKVADSLPFGERAGQNFILFRDKIFMIDRDVWTSSDAVHWEQLTPQIAQGDIYGNSPIVFDDKIWLIGCSRSGKFSSEVLSSSDGKSWAPSRAPWSPRGGTATCVFRNAIIMTGGKYGGQDPSHPKFVYSHDVWAMTKK